VSNTLVPRVLTSGTPLHRRSIFGHDYFVVFKFWIPVPFE
jgi:hypothetical protein